MKIKIIMAPLMIVISTILLIWFVYPAFTSPLDKSGVKEKYAEMSKRKEQLKNIGQKTNTIKELAQELNSSEMSSSRDTVMKFMPASMKEYEIIDNLNYLVLKEGLLGTNISISQPANETASSSNSPAASSNSGSDFTETGEIAPKATTFLVNFSVQGSYDKIKNVLERICGLERFNKINSLKIQPAVENKTTGNLNAVSMLEFAYFKESGTFNSIDDSVFSKTSFDLAVVNDIKKIKNTPLLPDLQINEKGKTSPFVP
jgi:Tfp pilus assembly protein PilO